MPTRHGIYRSIPIGLPKGTRLTAAQVPVFRFGILGVFEPLQAGLYLQSVDQRKLARRSS